MLHLPQNHSQNLDESPSQSRFASFCWNQEVDKGRTRCRSTNDNAQLLFIGIISNNISSLDPSFDYRLESAPNDHASHVKVAFQDSISSLFLNG